MPDLGQRDQEVVDSAWSEALFEQAAHGGGSGGHEDECGRIWRQSFYGTGGVYLRGHTEGSGEDEKPRTADAEPSTIAMEVGC
ncbi:hypothetical protein M6B38_409885 [Iris pallida]|uniref:Uncharacterized protein n=1 Tax=Iris pallida TaxID=29817 RepID=A0AAX6FPE9_IRIPA|nr:hypothetical protein M6B38_409885 [Iris pallida]